MNEYIKQAEDFLKSTGTKLTITFIEHDFYFADDKEPRDIYRFTLSRNGKSYTAKFGQSIASVGKEPSAYDILACLNPEEPETIDDIINTFGYEIHSAAEYRRLAKMAKDLKRQNAGLARLFNVDELNQLAEIN
jgi:hypothetical protein